MSNTPAESVPAAAPVVTEAAVSETARQPKKFDNVQKSVAHKAKNFLNAFHSAGENIRGNINAALDGAGDAIASRKSGEVSGRKSREEPSRSLAEPTAAEPAPALAAAPAPAEGEAQVSAPAAVQAPAPVEAEVQAPALAVSNAAVSESNAVAEATPQGNAEKKNPVGQLINLRFKRTVELIIRVGSSLRSKSARTAESLGTNLAEKKQRASRRFSRAPKAAPVSEEDAAAEAPLPVPAEAPLPDAPAITDQPTGTQ